MLNFIYDHLLEFILSISLSISVFFNIKLSINVYKQKNKYGDNIQNISERNNDNV
jgi:hypothetical protein